MNRPDIEANTPMEMERKQIIEALTEAQALIEEK